MKTGNNILKNIIFILLLVFASSFAKSDTRKRVIISFDDGYYSVYKYAYPVLKRYHIPTTIALISSYIVQGRPRQYAGPFAYMNQGEIRELIDSLNIEVASHSVYHHNLTKISLKEAEFEISTSKKVLDSLFNLEAITFVYPYGKANIPVIDLVKAAGYKLGRSTKWGEPNLWVDRYKIPIKEVRATTSIVEILTHIKYHKTTVLLFHRIVPVPAYFTEYSQTNFDNLLKMLKLDNQIEFVTLKDLYQQWWQDIMIKYVKEKGWLNYPILFEKINIDQTRTFNSSISK